MKEAPTDLRVLLGYARLKDRLGHPDEALNLYRQAVKAHADEASVYNNLAVHYAHLGMLPLAATAMQRAIRLQPKDVKYRNNAATVLMQLGRPQDAFLQLCAVHDEASAHYNLGFLMVKLGQRQSAALQFSLALRMNPSLAQARQWLDRLYGRPSAGPAAPPAMIATAGSPPSTPPSPPPEPQVASRTAPLPEQIAAPPAASNRDPGSWQEPPGARSIVPPPSASWSDSPPVVVRPNDVPPQQPDSPPSPELPQLPQQPSQDEQREQAVPPPP